MSRSSILVRYGALGALAFTAACVIHEAIGHGGTCQLMGRHVALLTSVFFRCEPGSAWVDAAGPLANLVAVLFGALMLRRAVPAHGTYRWWALFTAFNACWGSGYLIYSGLLDVGDWAFALRGITQDASVLIGLRVLCVATGVWLYGQTLQRLAPHLPHGAPLMAAYVGAGSMALFSVALSSHAEAQAYLEACNESWIALLGIAYLALRPRKRAALAEDTSGLPRLRVLLVVVMPTVVAVVVAMRVA